MKNPAAAENLSRLENDRAGLYNSIKDENIRFTEEVLP